ncbi:integration host factor, actinobacterial type [Streptomyces microflavus]|uniref:integration host factor, actinobacterial type n=1 Tax=Streptomyces microflavus TaxID=1919 RepID=UPI0037FDAEDC
MGVPPLSLDQRRAALKKATEARRERAAVKVALKQGETSLSEVLASDSEAISKMTVRSLLESLPAIGKMRAGKILVRLDISESRRVRGLGIQQRRRLLESLTSQR